jgi:sugar phosphate isomerase/epimerase
MKYRILSIIFFCFLTEGFSQKKSLKPLIGIADQIANDYILFNAGFAGNVESIGRLISPKTISDAQFEKNKAIFKSLKTPIYGFNIFIPGELKLVGPNVDEEAILAYVDEVLRRISETNTKLIIWGSGGARRLPEGWDREVAIKQFIHIAQKIAKAAKKYKIIIVLEPLNTTETNFINSVKEALHIVKEVNHPNLKLNVDIYHMLMDNEGPAIIAKTKKYLYHVEIAEKNGRTAPGVQGTDFRPYFIELSKLKYNRMIVIEGRWKNVADIAQMTKTFLQKQVDEVWGKK